MDYKEIEIERMCKRTLLAVEHLINTIKEENLQNKQFVLDFCDELNKLSVKY